MIKGNIVYQDKYGLGVVVKAEKEETSSILFMSEEKPISLKDEELIEIKSKFISYCMSEQFSSRFYNETYRKGKDYFESGKVKKVTIVGQYVYGEVEGSELYETRISLSNYSCRCSCPVGNNCKHAVALYFYLKYCLNILNNKYENYINAKDTGRGNIIKLIDSVLFNSDTSITPFHVIEDLAEHLNISYFVTMFDYIEKHYIFLNRTKFTELFEIVFENEDILGFVNQKIFSFSSYSFYRRIIECINYAKREVELSHSNNIYSRYDYHDIFIYELANFEFTKAFKSMLKGSGIRQIQKSTMRYVCERVDFNEELKNWYVENVTRNYDFYFSTKPIFERLEKETKKEILKSFYGNSLSMKDLVFLENEEKLEFLDKVYDFGDDSSEVLPLLDYCKKDSQKALILLKCLRQCEQKDQQKKILEKVKELPSSKYFAIYCSTILFNIQNYYRYHYRYNESSLLENGVEVTDDFFCYFKASFNVTSSDEELIVYYQVKDFEDETIFEATQENGNYTQTRNDFEEAGKMIYGYGICKAIEKKYQKDYDAQIEKAKQQIEEERKERIRSEAIRDMEKINRELVNSSVQLVSNKKASLEYHLQEEMDGFIISLKVGIDKHYVVKDAVSFLRYFYNEETFEYGKNFKFTHRISNFDEVDERSIELLEFSGANRYYNNNKYIHLNTFLVEELLRNLKGRMIYIDDEIYKVVLDEVKPEISVDENQILHYNFGDKKVYELRTMNIVCDNEGIHYFKTSKDEKMLYEFVQNVNGFDLKEIKESFTNNILSNYSSYIEVDDKIKSDYKLSRLMIGAYFDYKDKVIEVSSKYTLHEKQIALDKVKNSSDLNRLRQYKDYLSSMGFDEEGIMSSDNDILNFFYRDFSDLKKYADVYLSDSIKNKKLSGFHPGTITIHYQSNIMQAFLEESDYSSEELDTILKAIKRKKNYVLLDNDRIIDISKKESEEFYDTFEDLGLNAKKLEKGQTISVVDSLKALAHDSNCKVDAYLSKMIEEIANFKNQEFKVPAITSELRSYQIEGYKWLRVLCKYHLGGILADDMGLGKTIEIITLLLSDEKKAPSLIACPKSVVFNWINEIHKFAPELKVQEIMDLKDGRKKIIDAIQEDQRVIYVTAYDSLRNDIEDYQQKFHYFIIDEAQTIKNVNALKSISVKMIKADHYFALTGTPIENNIIDLWSIFEFILPGYLEDLKKFKSRYGDEESQKVLAKRISPFILRRTKQNVLKDLPSKYERILSADMVDAQRKIYDAERLNAKSKLDKGGKAFDLLPYLMRLRQICDDPCTYIDDYKGGSGKMNLLEETIDEYIENGHRLLIFSQFVKVLHIIEEKLKKKKIDYFLITGDTKAKERIQIADSFNNGSKEKICLISLKAGGTGLNLIGADTVIHVDPWWNVAAENQASDRSYRIGQVKNVEVIRLICNNSIEQRVIELQNIKKDLIDKLISNDESSINSASLEDIAFILD